LEEEPPMFKVSDTHFAATWLLHPNSPKVEPPTAVKERMAKFQAKQADSLKGGE
jgi:oligopeptide transport system ATP-binding protein